MARLYDKHELTYANSRDPYYDRMQSQYEFARDKLEPIANLISGTDETGEVAGANNQSISFIVFSKQLYICELTINR